MSLRDLVGRKKQKPLSSHILIFTPLALGPAVLRLLTRGADGRVARGHYYAYVGGYDTEPLDCAGEGQRARGGGRGGEAKGISSMRNRKHAEQRERKP